MPPEGQILAGGGAQARSVGKEGQSGLTSPPSLPHRSPNLLPKAMKFKGGPANPPQFHKLPPWPGGSSGALHPQANLFLVSLPSKKETHRLCG